MFNTVLVKSSCKPVKGFAPSAAAAVDDLFIVCFFDDDDCSNVKANA